MAHTIPARLTAALIAVTALASVGGQLAINVATGEHAGWLAAAWNMARYFTVLTNLLVAALLASVAVNRAPAGGVLAGALVSLLMVGAVYHALLAPEVPHRGPQFWTDLGYHTLTPLATLGWWLVWGDKGLRLTQVPRWLVWPMAYCAYALLRGTIEGRYPYFFLDLGRFGPGFVAAYVLGLVTAFAMAGLLLWAVARALHRRAATARI